MGQDIYIVVYRSLTRPSQEFNGWIHQHLPRPDLGSHMYVPTDDEAQAKLYDAIPEELRDELHDLINECAGNEICVA